MWPSAIIWINTCMQKGLCDQLFQPNIFRVATTEIILLEIGIAFPARHMGGRADGTTSLLNQPEQQKKREVSISTGSLKRKSGRSETFTGSRLHTGNWELGPLNIHTVWVPTGKSNLEVFVYIRIRGSLFSQWYIGRVYLRLKSKTAFKNWWYCIYRREEHELGGEYLLESVCGGILWCGPYQAQQSFQRPHTPAHTKN